MDSLDKELAELMDAWRAKNPGPNVIACYRGVAKSLLESNAKLAGSLARETKRADCNAEAAVQNLLSYQRVSGELATKVARIKELEAGLATAREWFASDVSPDPSAHPVIEKLARLSGQKE